MNKQRIKEILEFMEGVPLISTQETDSQETIELKLSCLMLLRENINLLLECANDIMGGADKEWDNWLKRHGIEEQ